MLDNNEILGDVEDARKAENAGNGGNTGNVREVRNTGDAGDVEDARNKEAGKGNEGREQDNAEIGNNEGGDGGDQEAGKVGYDRVGNRVNVGGISEDVKMSNNGMADGVGNKDNRYITIEDVEDYDDGVTIVVDPTNRVFADILVHLYGFSSS